MLHAALATAKVASARVLGIDTAAARAHADVVAVLTAADVPANSIGVIFGDQPLLVTDRVRMVGDRLALVAARTAEAAWTAARLVGASLEELPGVFDPVAAVADDAPLVNGASNVFRTFHVQRGDTAKQAKKAAVVVEAEYRVGGQDHAYLEPQGCLAIPEGRERITIVASCQCPFYIQQGVAAVLGLPLAAVRVEQAPTGGGFGGKEDYPTEPAACAALLARATGHPVRLIYPRELDLQATTKRHAMVVRHRWGADRDGRLRFAEVETFMDAGAYVGLSTVVAERANVSAIGPYHVGAVRVRYPRGLHQQPVRRRLPRLRRAAGDVGGRGDDGQARHAPRHRPGRAPPRQRARRQPADDLHRTATAHARCSPARCSTGPSSSPAGTASARRRPPPTAPWRHGMGVALVLYGCNLH